MNVSSPKKRVPTAKDRQNKSIPDLPAATLAVNNAIPKQNVGIDQTNQLQFDPEVGRIFSPIGRQTYFNEEDDSNIPFKTYIRIDEDPFEFLTEDLFDIPVSEDDISIQPEINEESVDELNEGINWISSSELFQSNESTPSSEDAPKENVSISTRKKGNKYSNEAVEKHPLTPIVKKWLSQVSDNKKVFSSKKSKINRFIQFLVEEEVDAPTKKDIELYNQSLFNDATVKCPGDYMSATRSFFRWTEEFNLYKNITKGTERRRHTYEARVGQGGQPEQQLIAAHQVTIIRQKAIITINDMERAKFLHNQAMYLINNDLIIFKQWIETLYAGSVDARKKVIFLRFAHFLHSENRTTPTQQDIIDYYKQYLSGFDCTTVNKTMVPIKRFFAWTAEKTIYPNIAINICPTDRKPINADDVPILCHKRKRKRIPNPTKPLINKTI